MRIKSLFVLPLAVVTLSGCTGPDVNFRYEIYTDIPGFTDGDYDFYFSPIKDKEKNNVHTVTFTMLLVYSGESPVSFRMYEPRFFNEDTKKEIDAEGYKVLRYELTKDTFETIDFTCYLDEPITQEKHNFTIQYEDKEIIYHLYDRPDDVREKYDVTFDLGDGTQEVRKIPEGRSPIDYPWVSADYLYSATKFFLDEEMTIEIDSEFLILEPTTLYCEPEQIFGFTDVDETSVAISKVNFVPTNGHIIFPKGFDGKKVVKINDNVTSGLKKLNTVYIPKGLEIAEKNLTHRALSRIYFEGNEEEWLAVNKAPISEDVEIIYNYEL